MSIVARDPGVVADMPRKRSRGGLIWDVIKGRPSAAVGAVLLGTFILIAIFAGLIAPYDVHTQVGSVFGHPSAQHWLGLDDGGIDMVSLLMYGARISLIVGFAAALVATFAGGLIGIVAGYFGGKPESVLMRITDYFLVIPDVPLMIVIATLWGPSLDHVILVIGLLLWTTTARIMRAQVKSLRERVYVKRARAMGASHWRIIGRHVLPQIAPLLVANVILAVAVAIFDESALAFLGLSDPSAVSWGTIIEHGFIRQAISTGAWWAIVPPGICIAIVIMGCYLIGQAIEDALNPRLKVAHLSIHGFRLRPLVGMDRDAL
ncbi:MAG: ABC transporter permease [Actinomycetota bacterium]